jgi:hypothetical protein
MVNILIFRLFNVLGKWIEKYWFDFETDPFCTSTALEFLSQVISNTSSEEHIKLSRVALSVKKKLDRKVNTPLPFHRPFLFSDSIFFGSTAKPWPRIN